MRYEGIPHWRCADLAHSRQHRGESRSRNRARSSRADNHGAKARGGEVRSQARARYRLRRRVLELLGRDRALPRCEGTFELLLIALELRTQRCRFLSAIAAVVE